MESFKSKIRILPLDKIQKIEQEIDTFLHFTDYIKEAHRCLKLDGMLYIIETTSRFKNLDEFIKGLEKLGFDVFKPQEKYKFTEIRALKTDRKLQPVVLSF